MVSQPITHKSPRKALSISASILESSNKNGIKCDWSGNVVTNEHHSNLIFLDWDFDWSELKNTGADRLFGYITVTSPYNHFTPQRIDVDFNSTISFVEKTIEFKSDKEPIASFEFFLIPHRSKVHKKVTYEEMFAPSKKNDTILVIDGKKLHVNKAFLSYHSDFFRALFSSITGDRNGYFSVTFDFFRALFSSNFKEGKMDEISIQDVSYEDFGLLMSTIHPETVYPNDNTFEKLLELADRFSIPAVIGHVQHHLLHNSCVLNIAKMGIADKYGMPELLEKCVREIHTLREFKWLTQSGDYKKLSNDSKVKLLDHLSLLI